jgi:hypothetical protein
MPDHGDQLGVDLNELYRTAHYLSDVETDFWEAVFSVNDAQPPPNAGPWTAVVSAWTTLRLAMADMLSDNAQTLCDTADTLTAIAQRYADADQAAAQRFTALQQSDPTEQGW